jgi:hypothetical protein
VDTLWGGKPPERQCGSKLPHSTEDLSSRQCENGMVLGFFIGRQDSPDSEVNQNVKENYRR